MTVRNSSRLPENLVVGRGIPDAQKLIRNSKMHKNDVIS